MTYQRTEHDVVLLDNCARQAVAGVTREARILRRRDWSSQRHLRRIPPEALDSFGRIYDRLVDARKTLSVAISGGEVTWERVRAAGEAVQDSRSGRLLLLPLPEWVVRLIRPGMRRAWRTPAWIRLARVHANSDERAPRGADGTSAS